MQNNLCMLSVQFMAVPLGGTAQIPAKPLTLDFLSGFIEESALFNFSAVAFQVCCTKAEPEDLCKG